MFAKASLIATVVAAIAVSAASNSPPYQGALLLQPGSDASKCLRADNKANSPAVLASCTGGSDQEWTWNNGKVTLHNGAQCLAVADNKNANGAKVIVRDCKDAPEGEWEYTPWGENHIKHVKFNKCVDFAGSTAPGNQPHLWDCNWSNPNQDWNTGYLYSKLPEKSEIGQLGTNNCGKDSKQDSMCQTMMINDVDDFCLWAPPNPNGAIGETEREEVAWCLKSGRGTRVIPDGTLTGVHFVKTPDYVQVTGKGDFTKINVKSGDGGGELDPHGADGNGNPIGGLVFGNSFGDHLQYHEWTSFIGPSQFCFRACVGPKARENCQHIYDEMGCDWNMPASYDAGTFESCKGDDSEPMGLYKQPDGSTSTFHQGQGPKPTAHPRPSSSECRSMPTVGSSPAKRDLSKERLVRRAADPSVTPPPRV